MSGHVSPSLATAIGFGAVVLWASLAALTIATTPVPPLLLNAITFAIGGGLGILWLAVTGGWRGLRHVPAGAWVLGIGGLFGYHAVYFTAFRIAPAAETGLVAYLWPLFIVLFSGLLPGERLRTGHVAGALVAFAGAATLVLARPSEGAANATGLALALACALIWAGYSVGARRFGAVPTGAVAIYCLGASVLSLALHAVVETPAWPAGPGGWLAIAALGAGPVGLAFYIWDVGVKRGDIRLLGVLSYAAPLLSTLLLIAVGIAPASPVLLLAATFITGGAALAARAGRADR
jgi:drug/metabolite transporter (DMT)-like permease